MTNFKQYIEENDKLNVFKKFAELAKSLDFEILDYIEKYFPESAQSKTLIKGSYNWQRIKDFIQTLIHDPSNEEYGVHWYGERERALSILNDFLDRNNFFDGI